MQVFMPALLALAVLGSFAFLIYVIGRRSIHRLESAYLDYRIAVCRAR